MTKTYTNPTPFPVADPYVMLAGDGRYYMYGSSMFDTVQEEGVFVAQSSADLATWRDEGVIYRKQEGAWCKDTFWAPECFYIDADLWIEDGHYYLYGSRCCYKNKVGELEESWIYGVEMKPDFSGIIGEPKLLLKPEQEWEGRPAPTQKRRWNEGSSIVKHNGLYYMTFSGNYYMEPHYAIGYATAKHPLGPWAKASENPILQQTAEVSGTGHNSLIWNQENGKLYMVYHGRTMETGDARVGFMDEVVFDEEGRMNVKGPTVTPQPL